MSTTKKASKNANATIAVTIKRGRGRPASFPGQECRAILSTIPEENIAQLHELKAKWGLNLNQTLVRVLARAHKDAFRSRSKKTATSTK
jgi:hypothetical protein